MSSKLVFHRKAADQLFCNADVDYDVKKLEEAVWKYSSTDSRLVVYVCDFFKVTSSLIGHFNAVFDRFVSKCLISVTFLS